MAFGGPIASCAAATATPPSSAQPPFALGATMDSARPSPSTQWAVVVAGLQQLGAPFWAENIVHRTALAGGVGLSRRRTRMREEEARRNQLRAQGSNRREPPRMNNRGRM
jgi:hypothetical protein